MTIEPMDANPASDKKKEKRKWLTVGAVAAIAALEAAIAAGLLPRAVGAVRPVLGALADLLGV